MKLKLKLASRGFFHKTFAHASVKDMVEDEWVCLKTKNNSLVKVRLSLQRIDPGTFIRGSTEVLGRTSLHPNLMD